MDNDGKYIVVDIVSAYICSVVDKVLTMASCVGVVSTIMFILLAISIYHGEHVESSTMIILLSLACVSLMIVVIVPSDQELRYKVIDRFINRKKGN